MSRSLGHTRCQICDGTVVLDETPRPITRKDTADSDVYFRDYEGLIVAHASCSFCKALYLARVDETQMVRKLFHMRKPTESEPFFDLSFRHSFDEDPDTLDLPTREMLKEVHRRECRDLARQHRVSALLLRSGAHEHEIQAVRWDDRARIGTSRWEQFRIVEISERTAPIPAILPSPRFTDRRCSRCAAGMASTWDSALDHWAHPDPAHADRLLFCDEPWRARVEHCCVECGGELVRCTCRPQCPGGRCPTCDQPHPTAQVSA